MDLQYLVLFLAWMLQFSVAYHAHRKKGITFADDDVQTMKFSAISHKRLLVKYDTLIQYGAVAFSKPGVVNYSTLMTDNGKRKGWKEGIYVGARNWLIKFDPLFNETDAVEIPPSSNETKMCEGKISAEDCHNFIKFTHVVDIFATRQVFVCGTFAYSPACSIRLAAGLSQEVGKITGGLSSGNPHVGMAAYLSADRLFLGLDVNPKSDEPTIQHTKLAQGALIIRTMENKNWLNEAKFVGAFSPSKNDQFVYYVFREIAIEAPVDGAIFSRVARICKEDKGGLEGYNNEFGSFTKAYLGCSEYHEVQAISYVENEAYFWATFTSDRKNGTAICGFRISDMEAVFRGPYLHRDDESHEWEECPPPYLHAGEKIAETCFGFRSLEAVVNYTMMSNFISPNCTEPSFITDAVLSKIAVSSGEQDVFTAFAGDDLGRVWKIDIVNCDAAEDVQVWEVVPANETSREINGLAIYNDSIIVLTHNAVMKILAEKGYPGEMIVEPTTTGTKSPLSTSPATSPRAPTTGSSTSKSTENPNYSYSRYNFSFSQTTLFLLSTALKMCF